MSLQFYYQLSCNAPGCLAGLGERKPLEKLLACREVIWGEAEAVGWSCDGKLHFCPAHADYQRLRAKGENVDALAVAALEDYSR